MLTQNHGTTQNLLKESHSCSKIRYNENSSAQKFGGKMWEQTKNVELIAEPSPLMKF